MAGYNFTITRRFIITIIAFDNSLVLEESFCRCLHYIAVNYRQALLMMISKRKRINTANQIKRQMINKQTIDQLASVVKSHGAFFVY